MDSFINLAKSGYSAYQESHSEVSRTGGEEYNRHPTGHQQPHHDFDEDGIVNQAAKHGEGDPSLFSHAMSFVKNNRGQQDEDVDEDEVRNAHDRAYNQGDTSGLGASAMGGAAALQALKMFTAGGGSSHGGGLGGIQPLISMAMAEASKLFDKSGGAASGNKQDVVNGAAMTAMKFAMQHGGGFTGGSNSGGLGSLVGLASKLM